jgi:hypothetical protein
MRLKTLLPMILISVIGVIFASFFTGSVLLGQSITPFGSLSNTADSGADGIIDTIIVSTNPSIDTIIEDSEAGSARFASGDLFEQWVPWIIQQVSILIGALSLIVFIYAGVTLIISGDNEEQLKTSSKMILFGIIGIALAGFSYTIVANVLSLL